MKLFLSAILIIVFLFQGFTQEPSTADTFPKAHNRYVLGFIPSQARNIYGLAIGPVGSEAICNRPYTKNSHGLNIQIPGQGIFLLFYLAQPPYRNAYATGNIEYETHLADTSLKRVVHNGLLISLFGTFSDQINGLSLSPLMSSGKTMNGITVNLLWNLYMKINGLSIGLVNNTLQMKGIQIGLVNRTVDLSGIQIGVWNRNKKRTLPLMNWNFCN